jgi:hypothetical protein
MYKKHTAISGIQRILGVEGVVDVEITINMRNWICSKIMNEESSVLKLAVINL